MNGTGRTIYDPERLLNVLSHSRAELTDGLSNAELAAIEHRHGFRFGPDQRELLSLTVPAGERWHDWRGPSQPLRDALAWPLEGVLFDVQHNQFWPSSWGERQRASKPPSTRPARA